MKRKFVFIMLVFMLGVCAIGTVIISLNNNEKINILIYGVDGREGVEEVERSDAIILLNYNFNTSNMVVTSVPRDSYVKVTCKNNSYDKVNHAYAYGGQTCLNNTVSQLFGINEVKNVLISFNSVIELVDYFGVIQITPKYTFCQSDENYEQRYCFEKDKRILINGEQALAYMRNRKSLPKGDLSRTENQRQIFKTIMEKVLRLSIIEKIKFFAFFKNKVNTDLEIKDFNLKKIININKINLSEYILKGEDYINKYYYYKLDEEYLENIKKYYI